MVIPYLNAHWHLIDLPAATLAAVRHYDAPSVLANLAAAGLVRTIAGRNTGEFIALAGVAPINDKEGEVFVLASCRALRYHPLTLARDVRKVLAEARDRFATISALGRDTPQLRRWFDWLGFEFTGKADDRPWASADSMLWTLRGGTT